MSTIITLSQRGEASRSRNDALVTAMYADYLRGMTMAEVGQKYGGRTLTAVYALFKRRDLKRRQHALPATWAKVAASRRAQLDALVAQMHADYTRPMSLAAVGRKYHRSGSCVRDLFILRGFSVRVTQRVPPHRSDGTVAPYIPKTPAEIDALIFGATRLTVPEPLRLEWRHWPLDRRNEFVRRVRAHLQPPDQMPTGPLSAGLEAFEYGHARAHAIKDRENIGCGSHPRCSIKTCSQGVIFRDQLWFWSPKVGYERGPWTPENGRPALHHVIYNEVHGAIPPSHVVRFADGNPNNLDPSNLVLASRNSVLRETQARVLNRKSRAITAMLLERAQNKKHNHDHISQIAQLRRASHRSRRNAAPVAAR